MDGTVNKDATVAGRISYKETGLIAEIAGVRTDKEWLANGFVGNLRRGVSVRSIKPSRETSHDLELGVLLRSINYCLGLQKNLNYAYCS